MNHPFPALLRFIPHDASPQTASNDPMPGAASILRCSRSNDPGFQRQLAPHPVLDLADRCPDSSAPASVAAPACSHDASDATRWCPIAGSSELLEASRRVIGTRRAPVLVETDAVDSPALFGLLRPKLLLPTGLIRRLDESELRHVFLHELAHLRRHDVLLNWLAALLQIIHWFNPMIWFGFARMRADREFACDALALIAERWHRPRRLRNDDPQTGQRPDPTTASRGTGWDQRGKSPPETPAPEYWNLSKAESTVDGNRNYCVALPDRCDTHRCPDEPGYQ